MKYGVILARFQPVHEGHLALIKKACSENDKVLLLVGSCDKLNARNPIPGNYRIEMLNEALKVNKLLDRCIVRPFEDLTSEGDNSIEWGFYLFAKVVNEIKDSAFTMYYSDGFEIITTWFPGTILKNHISLVLMARGQVEKGVSATQVRQAILSDDPELKNLVPLSVYNKRDVLKAFITVNKERI